MEEYIAIDSHTRYTWVEHEQLSSGKLRQYRLEHRPGAIREALAGCAPGTVVAGEATANWYWITNEIEQATVALSGMTTLKKNKTRKTKQEKQNKKNKTRNVTIAPLRKRRVRRPQKQR